MKRLKVIINLMVLLLIGSMFTGMVFAGDLDEPVVFTGKPQLEISGNTVFSAKAGESFNISVDIMNTGTAYAEDINASLVPSDASVYPEGNSYDSISGLGTSGPFGGRNRGTLSFRLKADENAEAGVHKLQLKISCRSGDYRANDSYKFEETIMVRISESGTSELLDIAKVDILPSNLQKGQDFIIGLRLVNKGDTNLKDIRLSLEGIKEDTFAITNGLNTQVISHLEKHEEKYISYFLKVNPKCKSGSYEIGVNVKYKDSKGKPVEDNRTLFLNVNTGGNVASSLVIENLKYPTGTLGVGQTGKVSFSVRNQGQTDAKNVVVSAESEDQSGLVSRTVSTIKIPSISPGEFHNLNFDFFTNKKAATKNYPISIKIKYLDEFGDGDDNAELTQFVGIFVQGIDEDTGDKAKSVPRVIIDKYSFDPKIVNAGNEFKMNLSFMNTNSARTIKNLKVTLTAEKESTKESQYNSSVFTPVNSSNTFYIDSIPPKGKVEKEITMFTVPDAEPKTHMIVANFEYEDDKANAYESRDQVGVPVVQETRLEVGDINYNNEMMAGMENNVSCQFYNTGKTTIFNLMLKLEGEGITGNELQYYVGNFQSGASDNFDVEFSANEPGTSKADIVFTYEDSAAKKHEERFPIEFTVNEMDMGMEFDEYGNPIEPGMEGMNGNGYPGMGDEESSFLDKALNLVKNWKFWTAIVIIALAAVFGIKYIKKRKEKGLDINE